MKKSKCMKCGRDNISPRHDVMLDQLKYRCNCGHVWFEATFESDIKSGIKSDESWEVPNDIPLDKPRAVSEEMAIVIEYYDNPKNKRRAPISMNEVNWRAIAADLLRLAERSEKKDQLLLACKHFITDFRNKVIEHGGKDQIVEFGLRSCLEFIEEETKETVAKEKPITPATAGKPKT